MASARVTPWKLAQLLGEAGLSDETLEAISYVLIIQWPNLTGYRTKRRRFVAHAKSHRDKAAA
jgi:hypothetical protein